MSELPPDFVHVQAAALRGADIGERRAQEIAADVARITDAADGARAMLDFNDEPARFDALLASAHAQPPRMKGGYGGKPGVRSVRAAARPKRKASAAAGRRK